MLILFQLVIFLLNFWSSQCHARWLGIPTVPFEEATLPGNFSLLHLRSIIVDANFQDAVDNDGETLIPPTLMDFVTTFGSDLGSSLGLAVSVSSGGGITQDSIFVTLDDSKNYLDAAGRPTHEGYSINITSQGITISGASPLGVWWGTRSILQQAVLQNMELSYGDVVDAPGWRVRGVMLDCGRHYYPLDFLIEMCSYLSFFKQNTFHLHLDDNPSVNPNVSYERKLDAYSAFRLNSPDSGVASLNKRLNESYTQEDFDEIQRKCASRGVTIIPEIEAPGHALVINQWKPELALNTDFTLLNISYPDTIPTLKTIWDTFLPWFHSKTVHIGADEYSRSEISEYNSYVNTMYGFIQERASKNIRIWGTFPPNTISDETNINANVSIQHWEFFEDNPYFDYIKNGYSVLNSDDAFYVVNKWSGSYPQSLNITRVFHGAPDGGPYAPNIFDTSNSTNNPDRDNPFVLGHVAALWNDFGPNATSVIEAYYALRNGLPALGDKQWGGDLLLSEYESIFETLQAAAPGQNLDRRIISNATTIRTSIFQLLQSVAESKGLSAQIPIVAQKSTIFSYNFSSVQGQTVVDGSGNGYSATLKGNCKISNSLLMLDSGCLVATPLTTKGRNYTLSFSINPTSDTPGTLFSGSDSALVAGNGSITNVLLITGGIAYPLNYSLPLNTWTDVSLVGCNNATYLNVSSAGEAAKVYEFTTTIGDYDNSFVWGNPMAIEAPIAEIGGDNFEGGIRNVALLDGADESYASIRAPLVIGVAPYT